MKRYGRLDENLQGTLQKNRVFCAVMPIHDQRISRRTETRRLFELTKLKKAPSFVIVGLFSADHYLVPCLSLLSSECVVFTDVPRDFQRLAEYFSDGWRREGVIDSSCLFKIGAEVRTVRWKISNNTHPVPVLNNTHPFPSKCSVDALCRVRESVRFASERSRVRIPLGPPICRIVLYGAAFLCLKNFGRPCRAPNPEVGCEPGGVIHVLFGNPSFSRLFLCILQSAAGKRIAFMPPFRKFLQKFPHHRRLVQP